MTRAFALLPEPAARARPVMRKSGCRGARKRLAVHPRQREHRAARFLGNGGYQAVGIPDYGIEPVAHRCLSDLSASTPRKDARAISVLSSITTSVTPRPLISPFPRPLVPAKAGEGI